MPIQGTDTREKGGHNPSLRTKLKFSGNQDLFWFIEKTDCLKVRIRLFQPVWLCCQPINFEGDMFKLLELKNIYFMFLLLGLVLFAACSTPQGNPANGKKWFSMHNCTACHGPHANDGKAPHIAGINMGFERFLGKIRSPDSPSMPPFPESKVSKQDAADIYAYLKSLK